MTGTRPNVHRFNKIAMLAEHYIFAVFAMSRIFIDDIVRMRR